MWPSEFAAVLQAVVLDFGSIISLAWGVVCASFFVWACGRG